MIEAINNFLVSPTTPLRDVVACIDRNTKGIALVVDDERHLLGTVTDGDIRRAILAKVSLESPADLLLDKPGTPYTEPITVREGAGRGEMMAIMKKNKIRQLPVLDEERRIIGLVTLDELMPEPALPLKAVIMAGGFGTRLRPATEETPKPMLPVGDRPLLEHTIDRLRDAGIKRVNITTHYLPEKITEHFGNGESFGVELTYVEEDRPLGTAGSLSLMEPPDETVLVLNGDLLTNVDFRSMLKFHRKHKADMTIGIRQYDLQVPFGVLESDGPYVQRLREKPTYNFMVNAGIYLIEPSAHGLIPKGERFDMTELIDMLLENGRKVANFPIVEYWLDIGRHEDYLQAQRRVQNEEA